VLHTAAGELRQRRPEVYQEIEGTRRPVEGRFTLAEGGATNDGRRWTVDREGGSAAIHPPSVVHRPSSATPVVGFEVGEYDRSRPLVIDPALVYSTYLGGAADDAAAAIAVDAAGQAYVTGVTASLNFPTQAPFQPAKAGLNDAFVTKFSSDGSTLVYSTYLGGSGNDAGSSIALDNATPSHPYIGGTTNSANFPGPAGVPPHVFGTRGAQDAFAVKIAADGSGIDFSTIVAGSSDDLGNGIAWDSFTN